MIHACSPAIVHWFENIDIKHKKHMEMLLVNHFWSHFREVSHHPPLCDLPRIRLVGNGWQRFGSPEPSPNQTGPPGGDIFPNDIHLKHMENLRYVIQSQISCQLEYRSKAYDGNSNQSMVEIWTTITIEQIHLKHIYTHTWNPLMILVFVGISALLQRIDLHKFLGG